MVVEIMILRAKIAFYIILLKYYKYFSPIFSFLIPRALKQGIINDYKKTEQKIQSMILEAIRLKNKQYGIYNGFVDPKASAGVNVLGFVRNYFGLAQQAISIGSSLQKAGVPVSYIDCSYLSPAQTVRCLPQEIEQRLSTKPIYNCTLLSLNSDMFVPLYLGLGHQFFENRYNIHYGAWELEHYPKNWVPAANLVHEFWAMSNFVKESVEKSLPIPVFFMPYAIDFEIPNHITRDKFNLPKNEFLFMFSYDMSSLSTRKNPKAVVEAFKIAFPQKSISSGGAETGPALVIKLSMDKKRPSHIADFKALQETIHNDKRIHIIDQSLTNEEMKGLINVCDVYVSLHRSEGFGMGMAEAMKMGKAVIATNYSGNTDFTNKDTACVVDYKLIDIKPGEYVHYEKGQVWADPYVEHAASHMQKLYSDHEFYSRIALSGKKFIDENYNHKVIGERFAHRLKSLALLP